MSVETESDAPPGVETRRSPLAATAPLATDANRGLDAAWLRFVARDPALAKRHARRPSVLAQPLTTSRRYSFYQSMRLLESRFGVDVAADDIALDALPWRLVQPARDGHVPSQVGDVRLPPVSVDMSRKAEGETSRVPTPIELECHFFGLLGPGGPLPDHVTELTRRCELDARIDGLTERGVFPDFLNLFNHRLLLLFYRLWKSAWPLARRTLDGNPYAAAVDGIGGALATGYPVHRALRRDLCLWFSGGLASAEGLRVIVSTWFSRERAGALDCRVVEHLPHRTQTPAGLQARLGGTGSTALGVGALLGSSHLDARHAVALCLTVADAAARDSLLPGGCRHAALRALLREYLGFDHAVVVHLAFDADALTRARANESYGALGVGARVGRDLWLGTPAAPDARPSVRCHGTTTVAVPILH